MAGILDGVLGGMLGGDSANMGTGILGSINSGLTNNAGLLLGMGSGLLSGQGWGAAMQGGMAGMQQDQRTRLLKEAQAEKVQKQQAIRDAAVKAGIDPNLALASPGVLSAAYIQKLSQGAPTEIQRNLTALGLKPGTDDYKAAYLKLSGLAKPTAAWGVIGKDDYGNERYGWIDATTQAVTPAQPAAASPQVAQVSGQDSASIPPPPPGVNPKIWRDEKTRAAVTQGQPTTDMRNKLAAAEKSAADLSSSLDSYNALVKQFGAEAWNGPAKARMQTAYTDVLVKMKEAANLGVLNGPDMELMSKQLEEGAKTGWDRVNPFAGATAFGIEGRVGAQVDQMKKSVNQGLENARRIYGGGQAAQPSAQQAVTRGQTATNPQTGERVIFDGQKWQPLKQMPISTGPQA